MKISRSLIFVTILIVSLAVNFFTLKKLYSLYVQSKVNVDNNQYNYLSLRIFSQNQNDILINFIQLRDQLRKIVNDDDRLALYFEYLPSGTSIGINEKKPFVLASLLKVPLVMGVYKKIDMKRLSLDKKIIIEEDFINKDFGTLWKKGAGVKITLKEAIKMTLVESDNTAKNAILSLTGQEEIENVFDSLDIPEVGESNDAVVTTKNYSSILRSLYLSSYVSKKYSNEILDFLTKSKFDDKIVAGIPKNIKVAHKIGVYESKNIYTDCGIVYVPKRPYIICLMTESDLQTAQQFMKDVSSTIYNYVSTKK